MLPGENVSVDGTEEQSNQNKGSESLKSAQEIRPVCEPVSGGNARPTGLISTQPLSAAAPPAEASQEEGVLSQPRSELQKTTCPRCGLTVPDHKLPSGSQSLSGLQGSRLLEQSGSRSGVAGSQEAAETPADVCFHLLLACLWCRCSVVLLGLLEACSCCLTALCSSCCQACSRCCSAVEDAPVEELNCHAHCHSVLFESCCEPTECLEFCLECCEICHRS
ncbi:myoD family inhibitor domain-containing protein-like [Mugil cephalus]|uniref:myoD family inhibitor domain-containing protein-like n=1 Tax=Mugil cephalus TaxID=48193 RepID=UPI001FB73218|nr:myoD family inhibitor domain-containing protein-like [Mugil cephalus]